MKRMLCYHPWHQTNGKAPPPSLVVGCCPRNFTCPACGFGAGEAPHENCQGWDEEPALVAKMLATPGLLEATEQGERDFEEGRFITLAELKVQLGDGP